MVRIHINLNFLVDIFRIGRFFRKSNNDYESKNKKIEFKEDDFEKKTKSTRMDWLESVTVKDVVSNVRSTLSHCNFFGDYGENIKIGINELSMEIALGLDGKSYTKEEIKNAFDEGIGTTTGTVVLDYTLNSLADYYYSHFYSEEKQLEYYEIGRAKREEN